MANSSTNSNNHEEVTKKLKRKIFLLSSLLLIGIIFIIYLIFQDNFAVKGVKFSNPGPDPNSVNEVEEFRTRPHIGTKFGVHGIYYDISGLKIFVDTFYKSIKPILNSNPDTLKILNDSLVLYTGPTTEYTSYGKDDTLFKGDILKVVVGCYWKRKDDSKYSSKPQFDFCIIPTLRINREKNPRDGVIDYFDNNSPLFNLYDHSQDDPSKYLGSGGASDNGTMFP